MLEFWHYDKNTEVSPEQVGISSPRKVWWRHICPTTGEEHEWQASVCVTYKAYMLDERLGRGEHRIPCPICWKCTWKELLREANQQIRKGLSAT